MIDRASIEADKAKAREAIDAYIEAYGPEVSMVDLRAFVRGRTAIAFGGPTLAAFLKARGYVREGVCKIDSCPGTSIFYVPGSPA